MQAPDTATTAVPPPPRPGDGVRRKPRSLALALFVAALLWWFCARMLADSASSGFAMRFDLGDFQPLAAALFLLFLVVCGIAALRMIERRKMPLRLTLGLPRRRTSREEWGIGAAIGWGMAVACVVPMVLARSLNVQLWTAPRAWELMALSIATLAVATLAHMLAIFGYGFHRLIDAIGPVRATMVMMALIVLRAGLEATPAGTPDGTRLLVAMLATLLLCLSWLRTHGLWLGWGLHFAWATATGVLFGLPLGGDASFSSVVDARAGGPLWLTGGIFGPTAAIFSIAVLLAAIPVLVKVTSDYAWDYTHPPLIPGGYDVTIAPPAAHTAMEQAAAAQPAPLVQILPTTPQSPVVDRPPQ